MYHLFLTCYQETDIWNMLANCLIKGQIHHSIRSVIPVKSTTEKSMVYSLLSNTLQNWDLNELKDL